ncbi:MAG: HAMP domain-containing histidine kinase [Flavobacteriales bacterium]|nr:HAMP domain-containing histidine kinase [Flavobacteriales bacterium]
MPYLEMVEKSVKKLDGFVQNIINYYQNLKKEEIIVPVNFQDLAQEVFGQHEHVDGSEAVDFRMTILQEGEFLADEMRLKMILNNLISNAIKYRDEEKSQPFFELKVHSNGAQAKLEVIDNGRGIDREHLGRIFEMFYRSSESSLGTGIGLYIVKEATEKLGGVVNAASKQGEGATFTVEIPNRK